jgi:hypothetical protein
MDLTNTPKTGGNTMGGVKLGVCYCQPGNTSECVANGHEEQFWCDFYQKHSFQKRCTNFNPDMNNHCWSPAAQDFGATHGVVRKNDVPPPKKYVIPEEAAAPTTYTLPKAVPPHPASVAGQVRQTCEHCMLHPGCPLLPIEAANVGKHLGSLTSTDMWNIGSSCQSYDYDGGI